MAEGTGGLEQSPLLDALREPLGVLAAQFEANAAELLAAAETLQRLASGERQQAEEPDHGWQSEPVRIEVKSADPDRVAALARRVAELPGVRAVAEERDGSAFNVTLGGPSQPPPSPARCFRCGRPVAKSGQSALCEACATAFKQQRQVPRRDRGAQRRLG